MYRSPSANIAARCYPRQSATIIGLIVSIFARNWAVSEALAHGQLSRKRHDWAVASGFTLACNLRQQVEFIKYGHVNVSFHFESLEN